MPTVLISGIPLPHFYNFQLNERATLAKTHVNEWRLPSELGFNSQLINTSMTSVDHQIEFNQPKHLSLKSFISYYYFSSSSSDDYLSEYFFYPHYKSTISVYQGSKVKWDEHGSENEPNAENEEVNTYFSHIVRNRFKVKTKGQFNKIGIVFNVLGINRFIKNSLCELAPDPVAIFDHFGEDFQEICRGIFNESSVERKVEILDDFFVSRLKPLPDPRVLKATDFFFQIEGNHSVEDVSSKMDMDRKTLYKLFKKHLCCSPIEFKRVVRFRDAVEQYMNSEDHLKLYQLAYDNYFYDQSHFIRTTEDLTSENPKQFFQSITKLGPEDTYWNFPDEEY